MATNVVPNLPAYVTIVSGLPRSGTSMMMRMLAAGGVPVLSEGGRDTDDDNPGGYFESAYLGQLGPDWTWLEDARGGAVKLFYRSLYALPMQHHYRVILMRRPPSEVLSSLHRWMVRHDRPWQVADVGQLADAYGRQLDDAVKWLHRRPNFSVLETDYYRVLEQPEVVVQDVNRFLDGRLDVVAMVQVPDPSLYRVRVENGDLALAGG